MATVSTRKAERTVSRFRLPTGGAFVVAVLIIVFGFYVLGPVLLIFVNSFNLAQVGAARGVVAGELAAGVLAAGYRRGAPQHPHRVRPVHSDQFPTRGAHRVGPSPHPSAVELRARVHVLGLLHGARYLRHHRVDVPHGPRRGHAEPPGRVPPVRRRGPVQHLQRPRHHLGAPDGQWHIRQGHAAHAGVPQHEPRVRGGRPACRAPRTYAP